MPSAHTSAISLQLYAIRALAAGQNPQAQPAAGAKLQTAKLAGL